MSDDLVSGFQKLRQTVKSIGGRLVKGTLIELYLDVHHDELIDRLAGALVQFSPEQIKEFVSTGTALPIPRDWFVQLKGFEEYIERVQVGRLFEWFAEANPQFAIILMDMGDQGIEYMISFKQYLVDTLKSISYEPVPEGAAQEEIPPEQPAPAPESDTAPPEQEASKPKRKRKTLTCEECNESFQVTAEEAEKIDRCPFCGAPA